MKLTRMAYVTEPIVTDSGECLYEMIGAPENLGGATQQSLACSVIPPGKYSASHKHKISAEILYVLEGKGRLIVDDKAFEVCAGDACLLEPGEVHSLINTSEDVELKLLAISAPPWQMSDVYME